MDLNNQVIQILNENKINKINEKIKYFQFEESNNKMKLYMKVKFIDNSKDNIKNYIYTNQLFDFYYFDNYYSQKFNYFQLQNYDNYYHFDTHNIKILLIQICSLLQELSKINELIKYYKNIYIIVSDLIKINYTDINDFNLFKKILAPIFFKLIIKKKLYSKYKNIKKIFTERQSIFLQLNKDNIVIDNIDETTFHYNYDKVLSSGEKIIDDILLELYTKNNSLLYYTNEYSLPVKFKKNLRADFFCIFIDKNKQVRKLIIEVNGEQHYHFTSFFNDSNLFLRDQIKKKYSNDNDIIFLEITYNQINKFSDIIHELFYL